MNLKMLSPAVGGWLLVAPALALLVGLSIFPTIYLLYKSLFNTTLLSPVAYFVGFENYLSIFTNALLRRDLINTALFVLIAVGLEIVIGMMLAIPLAAKTKANVVAATLLLLPFAITPVVSAMLWRQLFDPNFGWVDYYLQSLGAIDAPIDWFGGTFTSWVVLIALDVWQWTPFVALILMAGLQGIPSEPREAAEMDGANSRQIFFHITIPLMRPFLAVAFLLRVIEAFKTFGTIKVLTNGGPGSETETVNLAIYRVALQSFNIGSAAALGIVFLLLLSVLLPTAARLAFGRGSNIGERF